MHSFAERGWMDGKRMNSDAASRRDEFGTAQLESAA